MVNDARERYESALSLLNQISSTILEERERQDVLEEIIQRVAETFDARAGSIAVPDEKNEFLDFIAGFNREPEVLKRLNTTNRLRVGEGVAGKAHIEESICAVSNVFEADVFDEKFYHQAEREGVKAIFSTPLIASGECIGAVNLYYGEETSFNESFRKIMRLVSNQIAIAMLQSDLIEELEETNIRLKRLAETDSLTGLPNHRKIQGIFRQEMKRAERYDHSLSLMMIDLDHFKQINDTYGHPFGDSVLKKLSNEFLKQTRDVDAVGRYGGEEFMFVLPETSEKKASTLAERLRHSIETMEVKHNSTSIDATISIGIASNDPGENNPDELISRADDALLHAKEYGRNQVIQYSQIGESRNGKQEAKEGADPSATV